MFRSERICGSIFKSIYSTTDFAVDRIRRHQRSPDGPRPRGVAVNVRVGNMHAIGICLARAESQDQASQDSTISEPYSAFQSFRTLQPGYQGNSILARFAPELERWEFWKGGQHIQAIEAYPSACKRSLSIIAMRTPFYEEADGPVSLEKPKARFGLHHVDLEDALTCALIGWSFENQPDLLAHPPLTIDPSEGWIFVPCDGLKSLEHA